MQEQSGKCKYNNMIHVNNLLKDAKGTISNLIDASLRVNNIEIQIQQLRKKPLACNLTDSFMNITVHIVRHLFTSILISTYFSAFSMPPVFSSLFHLSGSDSETQKNYGVQKKV